MAGKLIACAPAHELTLCGSLSQAAADARGAADAQIVWLRANMGTHFSRKLLSVVRRIERHVSAHDDDPGHQFPRLAGSYLSEVSANSHCRNRCDQRCHADL